MKGLPRSTGRGASNAQRQDVIKQVIKFKNVAILVDGATGVGFGSAVIGDLPQGNILLLGAVAYVQVDSAGGQAGLGDTWSGDYSIGTAPTADATLSGAEIDIVGSTAIGPAVAEDAPRTRGVSVTATNAAVLDNTDGSLELNLNLLIDDADISADDVALTLTGELYLVYVALGDD